MSLVFKVTAGVTLAGVILLTLLLFMAWMAGAPERRVRAELTTWSCQSLWWTTTGTGGDEHQRRLRVLAAQEHRARCD